MTKIQLKSGGVYDIPKKGSLGLLAMGDLGLKAWRASKSGQDITFDLPEIKSHSKDQPKLVLIGWDAADWKIINPMIDAGLMPNLAGFIEQGTMGNLATMDPPYSPMLWTSIATGKRAYDHGVHGFSEVDPTGKNVQPVMSSSRKVKAIWNILGERQKKCHVVGWWPSHPAEEINGICISNLYQKHKGNNPAEWALPEGAVYPERDRKKFEDLRIHPNELTENHLTPFIPDAWKIDQTKDKRLQIVANITAETATLHNAFTHILQHEPYDFAALYLDGIDHYCHGFMKYFPPHRPHISRPDYDLFKNVIHSAYRFHDMMLGRILELIPKETTVMLISDHGFQPDHLRPKIIPKEPAGPAYEHSPYGIVVIKGPHIKKDELVFGASVIDTTPTILKVFNLPQADDMEGRVLNNLFTEYTPPDRIQSYESNKPFKAQSKISDSVKNHLMDHLIQLGYIEDNTDSIEQKIKRTQGECDFNLARACIEGGKIGEAEKLLEKLYSENPQTTRFAIRLAACYQMQGKNEEAKKIIVHLEELGVYSQEAIDIFEGSLLLGNGKPAEAIKRFKAAEKTLSEDNSDLNLQIAQCYVQLNRLKMAEDCLKKELNYNYDNAFVHQLMASCQFRQKNYKSAAEYSLSALGLNYNNSQNHATLGRSLYHLGQYKDAAHALEQCLKLTPRNNAIREILINLYSTQIMDEEKTAWHKKKLKSSYKGEIFVVSGLPRSGTSMLMQMLVAGGLEAFTDKARGADENNPQGYYEHQLVKNLQNNSNWIDLADHKLIKIVAPVIKHIPFNYKYRVIWIDRDISEVSQSQVKMLKRMNKEDDNINDLSQSLDLIKNNSRTWLENRPNVSLLKLEHAEILNNPINAASQLNSFFDNKLDAVKMAACVNPDLYREKSNFDFKSN